MKCLAIHGQQASRTHQPRTGTCLASTRAPLLADGDLSSNGTCAPAPFRDQTGRALALKSRRYGLGRGLRCGDRRRFGCSGRVLAGLAGGERRWSSTALITSRASPRPRRCWQSSRPGRCTRWRGNRAGVTDDGPLGERVRHHLSEPAGGNARVAGLAHHRLTAAAVEEACERLAEPAPGLRLSAGQVARIIDLAPRHPLAPASGPGSRIPAAP
jgi:hypothetical protein